ncbi:MAG: hypothetical protein IIU39_08590 [Ruminococcus sp.]|nr:hypothetical protein [Ruminococcus sp.]
MNGEDKILNRINSDCERAVRGILDEAEQKCSVINSQAEIQAKKAENEVFEKAKAREKQINNASKSRCELEIRNTILRKRRSEIDKTFEELQSYLVNLSDDEYFGFMYKLAETLDVESGTVLLNQKDLNRLPGDFTEKFQNVGISVTVSDSPVEIIGGFILKNGNVEENMAIDAVIMSKRDALEDIISRELFK